MLDIRPEERSGVVMAFGALFGVLAGHTLLETARDTLFLSRLPASQLPWMYLAIAALAIGISQGPWRAPLRLGGTRSLSLLLTTMAAATLAFWAFGSWTSAWALRALYVWTGLVGTLAVLQLWLVLGERYTMTQAKRLYGMIATGSLFGAMAGGWLARQIAARTSPEHLVLASAAAVALTGLGPALMLRQPSAQGAAAGRGRSPLREALVLVRSHPYVQGLAGLVLVSTVAFTLADYLFKSTVAAVVPREELGYFFGTFYMALSALALGAQILATRWILRLLGLHGALWILPSLMFLGAAGLALGGGVVAALLLKGADGALRGSLNRTSVELLFVPLPDSLRSRAKPFIDVVGQRGGQALASLGILGAVALHAGTAVLAAAAALLCLPWIAWAASLRRHYLDLFRAALREGSLRDRRDLPELDLGSLEALFAALNSRDDGEVIAALDLLAAEDRARLIPALVLYHPSVAVVLRALAILEASGRDDIVPIVDRMGGHPSEEVRAAALRARSKLRPDEAILRAASRDPSPLVRATALAGLVAGGWTSGETRQLVDALGRGPREEQIAVARAVELRPDPAFADALLRIAGSGEPDVQGHAARAMAAVRSERFLPRLLEMLASRVARGAARDALVAHGPGALRLLDGALSDRSLSHGIRRHVPRTISRFPAAEAAPVLLGHLLRETDGMVRFKIIRGLGRIAADHPEVPIDAAVLDQAIARTLEAAFRLVRWRSSLLAGAVEDPARALPGHHLLAGLLRDKEAHAVERLFRLLGLRHRDEDLRQIYRGLRDPDPKAGASSRELIEHLLHPPLRERVLALVDDAPAEARLARAGLDPAALDYETLLAALLDTPSETVRSMAAYHVGELGLAGQRERLEALVSGGGTSPLVTGVVERSLRLLSQRAAVARA